MKITGIKQVKGDGFSLRPIAEDDADLIVTASVSDVPDWTYIPRNLDRGPLEHGFREVSLPERVEWQCDL